MLERTLSIIKPDAIAKNLIGAIETRFEQADLHIVAAKMIWLTKQQAHDFYAEHEGKDFFEPLLRFMTCGPILVQVLEGAEAISRNRAVMGDTRPADALPGTIRADFAESTRFNMVHGSDSPTSSAREIAFFFEAEDIFSHADWQGMSHELRMQ